MVSPPAFPLESPEAVWRLLEGERYVAEEGLATAIFLALRLGRPLLLEGEPGVGKTEVARVLAQGLGVPLFRLQCYEGLELEQALYEWDHARQLLEVRLLEALGERDRERLHRSIYREEFLLKRPVLQALEVGRAVLLIDEVDRTDEAFEAFLLEVLSEFQVSVPELGTIRAPFRPAVVLTSNRTRELHDALRRRCVYYWIDYPSLEKELRIVHLRLPELPARLAEGLVRLVQAVRGLGLLKPPGVAEALDLGSALVAAGAGDLDPRVLEPFLGALLKTREDVERVRERLPSLLAAL
ncbi:AAA family ATPase [Thermus thermamylovorans]|uniref:AAA family ATPase n=1 Tax=Thermus thermamylovorans TaxID=2509362 RepID=UPI0022AB1114|nr:MoxR family ATPase [Thermus thermamylovorans]